MNYFERRRKAVEAYRDVMLDPSLGPVGKYLESPPEWKDKHWSRELRVFQDWHIISIRTSETRSALVRWCEKEPSITGHFWGNQSANLWYFSNEESALYFKMMKG